MPLDYRCPKHLRAILPIRQRATVAFQLLGDRLPALLHRSAYHVKLAQFLFGESQPGPDLLIQSCFLIQINRAMKQRTGGGDLEPLGADAVRGGLHELD